MKKEKATTSVTIPRKGRPPVNSNSTSSKKKIVKLSEKKPKSANKGKVAKTNKKECINSTTKHSLNLECNTSPMKKKHGIVSTLKTVSARLIEKIKKTL